MSALALQRIGSALTVDAAQPVREWKLPELPPGVRPPTPAKPLPGESAMAMDDAFLGPNYQWLGGFGAYGCTLTFPGYPYLANLTQISEYRAPSEVISSEMTRKWLKLVGKGEGDSADKIKELDDRLKDLKVREKFRRAAWQDGIYGRSQLYVEIKGDEGDEARARPLTIDDRGGGGARQPQKPDGD